MATDSSTGVLWRDESWRWITLRSAKAGTESVDSGAMDLSVSGEGDRLPLVDHLKRFSKDVGRKLSKNMSVAVDGSQALMRVVSLPDVSAGEMTDMAALQLDKFLPFPIETQSVSYEILGVKDGMCRVLIAAINRQLIEELGFACREAHIKLSRVDLDTVAWWRQVADAEQEESAGIHVYIIAETGHAHLIITKDGMPTTFLAMPTFGLSEDVVVTELVSELRFQLAAFDNRDDEIAEWAASVWVEGGDTSELASGLKRDLGVDVSSHELPDLASVERGVAERAISLKGSGLDLSLEEWQIAAVTRKTRIRMAKTAVTLLCLWGLALGGMRAVLAWEQEKFRVIDEQKVALEPARKDARSLKRRIATLTAYHDKDRSAVECLRLISMNLPEGLDLKGFTYTKDKAVVLSGQASNANAILAFHKAMTKQTMFKQVELPNYGSSRGGLLTFSISLLLEEDSK